MSLYPAPASHVILPSQRRLSRPQWAGIVLLFAGVGLVAWYVFGTRCTVTAFFSAGCVLCAEWIAARIALGGKALSATAGIVRLMVGMVAKWAVIFLMAALGVGVFHWPAVGMLSGVLNGLAVQCLLLLRFKQ